MRRSILRPLGLALALALTGAAPVMAAELPNWSGLWALRGNTLFDRATADPPDAISGMPYHRERPPYNAAWEAKYLANIERAAKGLFPDPNSTCGTPTGFPRIFSLPDTYEFVVRPEEFWVVAENGPNVLRVYTDGRAHPPADEMWPTYTGDSVGHWEGDTLVFDTLGVRGEPYQIVDRTGAVFSAQLRGVTRIRKIEPDVLEVKLTLTDPVALTKPWVVTKLFDRQKQKDVRAYDYACAENNRNPITADGYTLTLGTDGKPIDQPRP